MRFPIVMKMTAVDGDGVLDRRRPDHDDRPADTGEFDTGLHETPRAGRLERIVDTGTACELHDDLA